MDGIGLVVEVVDVEDELGSDSAMAIQQEWGNARRREDKTHRLIIYYTITGATSTAIPLSKNVWAAGVTLPQK